jgi:MoxR-like ATPase
MTTTAVLVETQAGELSQQTLIFPHKGDIHIYHRDSTGLTGRGQVWERVGEGYTFPDTQLTLLPVSIELTERDTELVDSGLVSNIGAKAVYALETAHPMVEVKTHKEAVAITVRSLRSSITPLSELFPDVTDESAPTQTNTDSSLAYNNMISVPDSKWSKEYINRNFEDNKSDFDIYDYALENDLNVLIEGGAGSGKTMSVIAYASNRGKRYFNVSSNAGIDPSQLFGRWIPKDDGQGYRWQDGAVTLLVRYGGVLLLNEVNFMPERIMTVLYSLLDDRREIQLLDNGGEVIKAHPDLLVVADMNAGYRGTHELSQANNDRWKIKLEFPYDSKIEGKLIKSKSLLELANKLRDQYDREEILTPVSTRGLVAFQKNALGLGLNLAITCYVNGFDKDERSAVRMSIEAMKVNIARDLGLVAEVPDVESDTVEEVATQLELDFDSGVL